MSFYATMQGNVKHPTKASFEEIVAKLRKTGYLKGNKFVDECGYIILDNGEPDILPESLTILYPLGYYRNLTYSLSMLMKDAKGLIVWTSTDGCFDGGILRDDEHEVTKDLTVWAEEKGFESPPCIDDFDEYVEWTNMIEQEFHDAHYKENT